MDLKRGKLNRAETRGNSMPAVLCRIGIVTCLVPEASVGRVVEGKEGTMALLSIASFIGESLLLIKSPQSSAKSRDTAGVNLMKHRLKM